MPTAPNLAALKGRLDRYFWVNNSAEMARLQKTFNAHFRDFDRVAVIGGLVRDFAREGRSGFRSDVDLVVDAPVDHVAILADRVGATPNRFGGFGFRDGPWKIDFWALEATWGRRHVPVRRIEDVLRCTFFDWDAVAYDLWDRKVICNGDYLERIRRKTLDINLRPNPSPQGNLVRAIRRLMLWRLRPGPQLRDFIEEQLDEASLHFVQMKEKELYRHPVSIQWCTVGAARRALFSSEDEQAPRQLSLSFARDGS